MAKRKLSGTQIAALRLAHTCVRNTPLEELHAGYFPRSKAGDYSDVKIVTPYGEIPWTEASRISDPEMKELMIHIVDAIYTALSDDPDTPAVILSHPPSEWLPPKLMASMITKDPEVKAALKRLSDTYAITVRELLEFG